MAVAGAASFGAVVAIAALVDEARDADDQAGQNLPPATAVVTRQTLVDTRTIDAELGNGPAIGVVARLPGTVTWLPETERVVGRGEALFRLDDASVILMHGSLPAYRPLGIGDEGNDVRQLEENLAALGYSDFTVDEKFTSATAAAVRRWQRDQGLDETGQVDLGRVVFAPGDVRIDSLQSAAGDVVSGGAPVLWYTGTSPVVTMKLDITDKGLVQADTAVTVALPDGRQIGGRVTAMYTIIEAANGGTQTLVEALVALDDPAVAADFDRAFVRVVLTVAKREDVLTVPVAALVALAEGGYGLEVVEGDTSRYVAVETGLFAGGRVEIRGDGIGAGMTVGMPA